MFENTSDETLAKLWCGLEAMVKEAPPDEGALTCALLAGLVKHEIETRIECAKKPTSSTPSGTGPYVGYVMDEDIRTTGPSRRTSSPSFDPTGERSEG